MGWKLGASVSKKDETEGIEIRQEEPTKSGPDSKGQSSSDEKTTQTEDLQILKEAHQWDPNLPLEKLEALENVASVDNAEKVAEIQREFIEDSPYEEVRAAVRNTDDESVANTVRAWILGLLFMTVVAAINMFLSMRSPAITIPTVVVILLVYPLGELWARVVPTKKFRTFGIDWTFNPGPWTIKEHTVVTLMANVTTGYPYSTNALEALQAKTLYDHDMGWGRYFVEMQRRRS